MAIKKQKRDETRIAKRVTNVLPVECQIMALPAMRLAHQNMRPGDKFGGRTINISRTGILINSDIELDLKTVLKVTLTLPDRGRTKMHMTAEVARVKRNAADMFGHWAMGLHVIKDEEGTMEFLAEYFKD